jgi:hypothetical protein
MTHILTDSLSKILLFKKNLSSPIFLIVLVTICALAVNSNYKVSISLTDGFRFEPAQIQPSHT